VRERTDTKKTETKTRRLLPPTTTNKKTYRYEKIYIYARSRDYGGGNVLPRSRRTGNDKEGIQKLR
jgi:hypothetical protein